MSRIAFILIYALWLTENSAMPHWLKTTGLVKQQCQNLYLFIEDTWVVESKIYNKFNLV